MDEKRVKKKRLMNLVLAAAVCVIAFGGWRIYDLNHQYERAAGEYENLQQLAVDEAEANDAPDPDIQVDVRALQTANPDTVGWLYYPALGINYPIMQDDDNQYYLTHTFEGDRNVAASVFLDCAVHSDFNDMYSIVYGHNMRDGSMFGRLKEMRGEGVAAQNPYFWVFLPDAVNTYRIFSYHDAQADREDMSFQVGIDGKKAFRKLIKSLQDVSEADLGVKVKASDRVVTLSTCTGNASVRFVVHGVLEKEKKNG